MPTDQDLLKVMFEQYQEYMNRMYKALEAELLYGVNWRDALKTLENPIEYEEVKDGVF